MTLVELKQYYDKLDALFRQQAVTMRYFDESKGQCNREEIERLSRMVQELQSEMRKELIALGYNKDFADDLVHAFDHKSAQYYEEIKESRRFAYGTCNH